MSTKKIAYFPSLYDPSPESEDIWAMMMSRHGLAEPSAADGGAWPNTGILTVAKYQPLEFYCPPVGPAVSWGEGDDMCELGIRLKEIELLTLMGETLTADDIVSGCNAKARQR